MYPVLICPCDNMPSVSLILKSIHIYLPWVYSASQADPWPMRNHLMLHKQIVAFLPMAWLNKMNASDCLPFQTHWWTCIRCSALFLYFCLFVLFLFLSCASEDKHTFKSCYWIIIKKIIILTFSFDWRLRSDCRVVKICSIP